MSTLFLPLCRGPVVLPRRAGAGLGLGSWCSVGGVCSFGPAKGVPPALCRLLGSCPSSGSMGGTTRPRPVELIVDIPPSPLGCKTCKPPFLCWWHHSNYLIFKFFTILNTEWYLFGLVAYLQSTPSIYRHNLFFTCLWRNTFYFIYFIRSLCWEALYHHSHLQVGPWVKL